ncbi:hypothetical protein C2G38_2096882 [Gigaspora rosea]|uniref:Uncharacterized protein n=1 Tax=Gigaspora rosea TaxID=44941 RepID=A0A397UY03_9GLOM|nr:hypothetical protein C2G38_2096882 [Gigaspora rosea]
MSKIVNKNQLSIFFNCFDYYFYVTVTPDYLRTCWCTIALILIIFTSNINQK